MGNVKFYNIWDAPFKTYGLYGDTEKDGFRRLPEEVAKNTSSEVHRIHTHTTGGRVRFRTDSETVTLKIKAQYYTTYHTTAMMRHGADLYIDYPYASVCMGAIKPEGAPESETTVTMPEGEHDVTVYLPLFCDVYSFEIGICEGATLKDHSKPYQNELPVVFYGSSITHGACASRPGLSYEGIISRKYNMNYTNLGFSGSAMGEDAIGDYMATLEMAAFVSDYDYNAPTPEHLEATHHKLYQKIRAKNPDIPYFMITHPNFQFTEESIIRRDIIMQSYLDARDSGDKNVYFIDGSAFYNGETIEDMTIDLTHPNDAGFKKMASYIGDVIAKVMKL